MLNKLKKKVKRKTCDQCIYYNPILNFCQSKKVSNNGYGEVTLFDMLMCSPRTK